MGTSPEFDNGVPTKNEPLKNDLPEDSPLPSAPSQKADAAPPPGMPPPGITTEAQRPRRKSKTQRAAFDGDVAAMELRSRLAKSRDGIPQPAEPVPSVPRLASVMRATGGVVMAAAAACAIGYVSGFELTSKSTRLPPAARQATPVSALSVVKPKTTDRGDERPAVQTATLDLPADARRAGQDPASVGTLRPPAPTPMPPRTVLPSPVPATADAAEIATRMKIGAELVANGDITAARKMFERVAEAGEAAGAFALAETYDPVVLGTLPLQGAIMPDPELARTWYEKARDLGASAAPERIARLARNSQ